MAGSRKGIPNKRTEAFRDWLKRYCDETGTNPHVWMADLLKKPKATLEIKIQAAKELAQYLEPKLRSTELTGNPEKPVTHALDPESRRALLDALEAKRHGLNGT